MKDKKQWNGFILEMLKHFFNIDALAIIFRMMEQRYSYVLEKQKIATEITFELTEEMSDLFLKVSTSADLQDDDFIQLLYLESKTGESLIFSHKERGCEKLGGTFDKNILRFGVRVLISVNNFHEQVIFRKAQAVIFVNDVGPEKLQRKIISRLRDVITEENRLEIILAAAYALGLDKTAIERKKVPLVKT